MPTGIDYTPDEWPVSTSHRPLRQLEAADLLLLHRHWMWTNQQREAFDHLLKTPSVEALTPGPLMLATKEMGFMFAWYGLLWSVIEAFGDRKIDLRGVLSEDIDRMAALLRRCRNAVMHVPTKPILLDSRIEDLVSEPTSAETIRRIHRALGRLFREEFQKQTEESKAQSDAQT